MSLTLFLSLFLYPTQGLCHESRKRKQNAHKSFLNARAEAGDRLFQIYLCHHILSRSSVITQWQFLVSQNELACDHLSRPSSSSSVRRSWGHRTPTGSSRAHLEPQLRSRWWTPTTIIAKQYRPPGSFDGSSVLYGLAVAKFQTLAPRGDYLELSMTGK